MSNADDDFGVAKLYGVEHPPKIKICALRKSLAVFTRMTTAHAPLGRIKQPVADASLITYKIRRQETTRVWLNGRYHLKQPTPEGYFDFRDLRVPMEAVSDEGFDTINMYWMHSTVKELAIENEIQLNDIPQSDYINARKDLIVQKLMSIIRIALDRPQEMNRFFLDHIGLALLNHLNSHHVNVRIEPQTERGALAPWQERRAKELLATHLHAELTLEDLARECGISRSHFARAFKKSTGQPPHRWLMAQRVNRAEGLLAAPSLTIAEIAIVCGFADQSHFTRVFTASRGLPPGEWRRRNRL